MVVVSTIMVVSYDLETTGTSPAFDQPIQFAAILTDDDFNQIEHIYIRYRLSGTLGSKLPIAAERIKVRTEDFPDLYAYRNPV